MKWSGWCFERLAYTGLADLVQQMRLSVTHTDLRRYVCLPAISCGFWIVCSSTARVKGSSACMRRL
jgi:hypothetical protein